MYHLAVIPIFSPVFVEAYEAATGLYLDEDHINLATWHNVLISLAIARKTGNREEEAWTLETARRLPVFLFTPSCAGRSLRSLGFRRIRGAGHCTLTAERHHEQGCGAPVTITSSVSSHRG